MKMDPRIKIPLSFLFIMALAMMKQWYIPVFVSGLCILFAAKLRAVGDYCRKLVYPIILALFILAVQGFTSYSGGFEYGFLIFSRVLASASVLMLLVLTTSENEMLKTLRWLRVPSTMIDISSFMVRYIKTFSDEGKKLKFAQESRCGFSKNAGFAKRMHNIASLFGLLITKASARSENIYRAMLSRAWKPNMRYSMDNSLNKKEALLGIMISAGIIALLGLDMLLR